jgi:hypothetical protein
MKEQRNESITVTSRTPATAQENQHTEAAKQRGAGLGDDIVLDIRQGTLIQVQATTKQQADRRVGEQTGRPIVYGPCKIHRVESARQRGGQIDRSQRVAGDREGPIVGCRRVGVKGITVRRVGGRREKDGIRIIREKIASGSRLINSCVAPRGRVDPSSVCPGGGVGREVGTAIKHSEAELV